MGTFPKNIITWAETASSQPYFSNNVVAPANTYQQSGFPLQGRIPRQVMNWLLNNVMGAIYHLYKGRGQNNESTTALKVWDSHKEFLENSQYGDYGIIVNRKIRRGLKGNTSMFVQDIDYSVPTNEQTYGWSDETLTLSSGNVTSLVSPSNTIYLPNRKAYYLKPYTESAVYKVALMEIDVETGVTKVKKENIFNSADLFEAVNDQNSTDAHDATKEQYECLIAFDGRQWLMCYSVNSTKNKSHYVFIDYKTLEIKRFLNISGGENFTHLCGAMDDFYAIAPRGITSTGMYLFYKITFDGVNYTHTPIKDANHEVVAGITLNRGRYFKILGTSQAVFFQYCNKIYQFFYNIKYPYIDNATLEHEYEYLDTTLHEHVINFEPDMISNGNISLYQAEALSFVSLEANDKNLIVSYDLPSTISPGGSVKRVNKYGNRVREYSLEYYNTTVIDAVYDYQLQSQYTDRIYSTVDRVVDSQSKEYAFSTYDTIDGYPDEVTHCSLLVAVANDGYNTHRGYMCYDGFDYTETHGNSNFQYVTPVIYSGGDNSLTPYQFDLNTFAFTTTCHNNRKYVVEDFLRFLTYQSSYYTLLQGIFYSDSTGYGSDIFDVASPLETGTQRNYSKAGAYNAQRLLSKRMYCDGYYAYANNRRFYICNDDYIIIKKVEPHKNNIHYGCDFYRVG